MSKCHVICNYVQSQSNALLIKVITIIDYFKITTSTVLANEETFKQRQQFLNQIADL